MFHPTGEQLNIVIIMIIVVIAIVIVIVIVSVISNVTIKLSSPDFQTTG